MEYLSLEKPGKTFIDVLQEKTDCGLFLHIQQHIIQGEVDHSHNSVN